MVYLVSLGLNVSVNALVIAGSKMAGLDRTSSLALGFLAATAVSAASNFLGMKQFVFRPGEAGAATAAVRPGAKAASRASG